MNNLTTSEVLEIANRKFNIQMSRRNFLKLEHDGLISSPERDKDKPRGSTEAYYSKEVLNEFFAAYRLIHGLYGKNFLDVDLGSRAPKIGIPVIRQARQIIKEYKSSREFFKNRPSMAVLDFSFLYFVVVVWENQYGIADCELTRDHE